MIRSDLLLIEENKISRALYLVSLGCGFFALSIGIVTLSGWIFDVSALKTLLPQWTTMKANSAIGLILCAVSLLSHLTKRNLIYSRLASMLGAAAAVIGALTLAQYALNIDLGIDELFFRDEHSFIFPGRMAPATALNLIVTGIALFFVPFRLAIISQILAIAVFCRSLIAILGYLYGATLLFKDGVYTAMAFHTSAAFVALSVGVFFARPESGYTARLCADDMGSMLLRKLMIPMFVLLIVLGCIPVLAQNVENYTTGLGVALMVLIAMDVIGYLIWRNADLISRNERLRNEVLRIVLDHTEAVVLSLCKKGKITASNRAADDVFGHEPGGLVGLSFSDLLSAECVTEATRRFMEMKLGTTIEVFESRGVHKSGSLVEISISMTPILDLYGEAFAAVAVIRPLSSRKPPS